jgi:hypothetical protein
MNAYLVSHNGLGDNLFMIGAIRFLLQFYNKIFFLCKNKYYDNVKLVFYDNLNVICVPFNENNEYNDIYNIIHKKYYYNDILICGCHTQYISTKINHRSLLKYRNINNKYTIDFDTLTSSNYYFIENFYKNINLNLTHFFDYFYIPSTSQSVQLYNSIKNYYIVFIQLKSSNGISLNIQNLINKYLHDKNTILICNDLNIYDKNINPLFFDLAQQFVYNYIIHYYDTILNSNEIYIIDSCFTGIVLPLAKTNKLKANTVRIILRNLANNIIL